MRIRITKLGIFGVIAGESTEIPVGTEFDVEKEPLDWKGRYEVISRDTPEEGLVTNDGDELDEDPDAAGDNEPDESEEDEKPRSRRRR